MTTWFRKQLERIGVVSAQAEALAADANTPPVSVLLVDDTPDNLQVLMETLKPLGHKLLAAKDGESALAVARRANPALILLDVMMPGMDGYEVCRRLKADPALAQSAVIFCSALDDTAAKVRGLALGAVDFVTKPFEPEEVVARVGTHLAVQQLARSLTLRNRQLTRELAVAQTGKADALRRLDWAFAGTSTALTQLKAALAAAAAAATPVLLRSLPACGAELAARVIHAGSPRAGGAFILVDGAPLHATTAFETPAFALGGAEPSRLELADGGTLCIDHADRLDGAALDQFAAYVAARGEGRTDVPDVRLVAITARLTGAPLPERFPAQLEQALTLNLIALPALAERRDDIVPMAEALLQRQGHALGHRLRAFDGISRKRLTGHDWPGNLRELEDVVARSAAAAPADATTANVDPGLLAGGIALGSYRLIRKLGAGGFGEVWEARHQLLARPAAVKLILDAAAGETDAVERFRLEATATASLGSPHTVTLYDFGVSEQGQFYYVMELLDGLDLDQLAGAHGVLPAARLAHFLVHACRSLAEAHARGMIHRDLKPSNLFACRLGLEVDVLKILDFGLVRKTGSQVQSRLTQKDVIIGTPDFMPPETATGEGEQDGRTDMYSLAATAYGLLAGRPVFQGTTPMQVLMHHIRTTPEPLTKVAPGTPKAFSDLIMAALAKGRADRPDAPAFLDALLASGLPQQWTERDRQAWWRQHRPM